MAKLLGAKVMADAPSDDADWYANLIYLERHKCLMLTHAGTLFTVLAADARKADVTPVGDFICRVIQRELDTESLALDALGTCFHPTSSWPGPPVVACSAV